MTHHIERERCYSMSMVPSSYALPLLCLSVSLSSVHGHGSLVSPRSRNSVDFLVDVNTQPCANVTGDACNNGQASFWYSQGCFIGCPFCDHLSGRRQVDLCGLGMNATVNDPLQRSINRNATAGSPKDIYRHNPWRAPGSAPVGDVCGFAGGTPWGANVSEEGVYTETSFAHHGMRGGELPPLPGVAPPCGSSEASRSDMADPNNHGGGYQYRICKADELSEAYFQAPLSSSESARRSSSQRNAAPHQGHVHRPGHAAGGAWSMLPIPPTWLPALPWRRLQWEHGLVDGQNDRAQARQMAIAHAATTAHAPRSSPRASRTSDATATAARPLSPAVLDVVRIPKDLPAGDYVLGWRYDCEATAQVWSNCADVKLVV